MILYIGNFLSKHGKTPTHAENLIIELLKFLDVKFASSYKNKVLRIFDMWALIIKNRKSKILIIDTYSTSAFYFAYTASKLAIFFKIKYVPILHGGDLINKYKQNPKLLKDFLEKSHYVISPSLFLKSFFKSKINSKFVVIPNFVNISDYKKYENQYNKFESKIRLLWVRSLHSIYNPLMAVKLLNSLLELNFNVKLCMIGPDKDGSKDDILKLIKKFDIMDKVELTGKLSKKQWMKKSLNYNYFINTTNFDNMPVSVIEAMALGLPVISTNVGGLPYLIENNKNGFLVKPNDYVDMAEKIIQLYNDKEKYNEIIQEAHKSIKDFNKDTVIQKWIKILKKDL